MTALQTAVRAVSKGVLLLSMTSASVLAVEPANSPPVPIGEHVVKAYPEDALRSLQEGTTILAFTIGADGKVSSPSIVRSSGSPALDQAALAGVLSWLYKPAIQGGRPIAVPWKAQVVFRLADQYDSPSRPYELVELQAADLPVDVRGTTGICWVYVVVDQDGTVGSVQLMHTSGSPHLDQAALTKVTTMHFTAALLDRRPIRTIVMLGMRWAGMNPQ